MDRLSTLPKDVVLLIAAALDARAVAALRASCSSLRAALPPRGEHSAAAARLYLETYDPNAVCRAAAAAGNLPLLREARRRGRPWDSRTCREAAANGHLDCLRYAHENGCAWNEWTCTSAIRERRLDCLRYACANGCPRGTFTSAVAAETGVAFLRVLRESGCPWDEWTCRAAAASGRLDCLRYAYENGCAWSVRVYEEAAKNDQLECLQYALDDCVVR